MRRALAVALTVLICGCSGKNPAVPSAADTMMSYAEAGVTLAFPGIGQLDAVLPFLLNPNSPGAAGYQFQPDTSPGAPPNSYTFVIPLDGDSNGSVETMLTGTCRLTGDPSIAAVGFGGSVDVSINSVGGLGDFTGTLDFVRVEGGATLCGTGTFTDNMTGNTTSIRIDPATPLLSKPATGAPNAMPNACGYSLAGDVEADITGPMGTLSTDMNFSSSRQTVMQTHVTYDDGHGTQVNLPESEFDIPCGEGSIQDWTGTFLQNWACLPEENGQARLTITVTGPSTIHIVDEDPPGSGHVDSYDATVLAGSPHIVRGFFIGGPAGNTYREDFTWTLAPGRGTFSQVSLYAYQEGSHPLPGGLCSGIATREP